MSLRALLFAAIYALCLCAAPLTTSAEEAPPRLAAITIVYDNSSISPSLKADWGFSCLLETGESTVLFDTGADGATLLSNLAALGKDPTRISAVVISHDHPDHTGGLQSLLAAGASPILYVPAGSTSVGWGRLRGRIPVVEVASPIEVAPGIVATGPVPGDLAEQAISLRTGDGLVVITGCAHPGAAQMVRAAREAGSPPISLLIGGFHLYEASDATIEEMAEELRDLGVERVAPAHCTGERAAASLSRTFGSGFMEAAAGSSFGYVALP